MWRRVFASSPRDTRGLPLQFPIYDAYMEARSDPSLDARDLESLDLEAREYLEYLEAREAATAEMCYLGLT